MPFDIIAGPQRSRSRRYLALGLIQSILALEALGFAVFPPSTASPRSTDFVVAGSLAALAIATAAVLPHLPRGLIHVSIALTWVCVALLAWTRATPQGQVTVGLSLLLLTMYVSYFLLPPATWVHIIASSVLYAMALALHPMTRSPLFAIVILASVGYAAVGVPRARDIDLRYRLLLANSADIVMRTREGRVVWVSPSVTDLLGWQPEEFMGADAPLWHADDTSEVEAMRQEVYAGRQASGTYRLRCKDGTYRWVEARLSPIRDGDGARGSVASVRDVHERVLASRALAAAEERYREIARELEVQAEARTRLFQNLSHELRTPLTLIRGPLQHHLSTDDPVVTGELRADLEMAVRAGRRLERLVDDILEASRASSPAQAEATQPTDPARLTRESARVFDATAAAAGLSLDVIIDAGMPSWVRLRPEAWTRILLNLISNAIKYTEMGGIRVELNWAAGWLHLRVHDTGVGIPAEELGRVFERFYQARVRTVRGESTSGVGLALVADLVGASGGTCSVDSVVGEGSTFVVTMPAPECAGPSEAEQKVADVSAEDATDDASVGYRVLVVADDAETRRYLIRLLTEGGISAVAVADVRAAQLALGSVDAVLADNSLPDQGSLELLLAIRAQEAPEGLVPVLLMAGSVEDQEVALALRAGANDYVSTPFDPRELLDRVRIHCQLHRHRRSALEASGGGSGLQAVLTQDETVGAAIGALMARRMAAPEEALAELRRLGRSTGRSLPAVAAEFLADAARTEDAPVDPMD